ncbi:MAG: hypothetical protein N4A76_16980 [Firmicutes bacterium]|nr:hypothetical protein [Bacillota bacterium]
MVRVKSFFTISFLIIFMFIINPMNMDTDYNKASYDYYVENGLEEVGSNNLVTGIYLDYRLFDSIFEAAILFVAVSGVLFMGRKDESSL